MLYYDVVELPESPIAWLEKVNMMEMGGCVALGDFLFKATETDYGFDLVVLDSICDRIKFQRATVHALLIQFADPKKISFTQIASTLNAALMEGKSELEVSKRYRLSCMPCINSLQISSQQKAPSTTYGMQ